MEFDKIINKTIESEKIQYGIVIGNEKIVFIKSGAYGNINGSEGKYLKMAYKLRERLGATVICASNPEVEHKALDEKAIRWVVSQKKFNRFQLYFAGVSDGAYQNLALAKKFPETVKFLGINTSFIEVSELQEKIEALQNVEKIFVYGTKDYDYDEVVPVLTGMESDTLKVLEVEGADHKFTGMLNKFIALADLL